MLRSLNTIIKIITIVPLFHKSAAYIQQKELGIQLNMSLLIYIELINYKKYK